MAACLLLTGFSFWIPPASSFHIVLIALGIYTFAAAYSPGAGPVPFVYSAEAYPLAIRAQGMSLATATTWFFNFLLSVTWPSLLAAWGPQAAFAFYAAWNLVGWFAVLLLVPETKGRSLEDLDAVFSIPTKVHVARGLLQLQSVCRYICRRRSPDTSRHVRGDADSDVNFDVGYDSDAEGDVEMEHLVHARTLQESSVSI